MKKRFMFFVQKRGGGTVFNRLLASIDDSEFTEEGQKSLEKPFARIVPLPTVEKCIFHSLFTSVPELLKDSPCSPTELCAYSVYAEFGYHGSTLPDSNIITDPFYSPSKVVSNLPPPQWRIFSLLRDGRNQVTSRLIGDVYGHQPKHGKECISMLDDLNKFRAACISWKIKASWNLQSAAIHSDYHLIFFEELIKDPHQFVVQIFI